MFAFRLNPRRSRGLVACCVFAAMLTAAPLARAQTALEQAASLALVPEDAAAYGAILHNKDLFDAIVGSKAYAKVAEMEQVKPMLELAKLQWEANTADPAIKGVVAALLDGLSEEMFFYTDPTYGRFMRIYQQASSQGNFANVFAAAGGEAGDPTAQLTAMLDVLADNVDELKVPTLVIGMRVKDPAAAEGLVSLAKLTIGQQLADMPEDYQKRFTDETVGGVKLMTFKFDGGMLPWDELPLDELPEPGKYDALVEKLKGMTVSLSMGVKDNFLLISMGETNAHVGLLGQGRGLAGRPEMAKLAAVEGKKLRSINYVSQEAASLSVESAMAPVLTMLSSIPAALPEEVDDMLRRRIEADLKELSKDLQGQVPQPGAKLSVSTFSPRGFDTLTYDWSENQELDSSKPLTLLEHLGGNPIAFYAAREKQDPEQYDLLVKWLKKADGYLLEIAAADGGEEAEKYKKFRSAIDPLLARLDTANREMLIPALADGQSAVVLDAQITSTQWLSLMPPSPHPLPMFELGMVFGVSDAGLLQKGCQEYFAAANELIKILREMEPDQVTVEALPPPQERKFGESTIWYYMLPKEWGVDKRIAPNAGLSETAAALSLAPLHTKRLLEKSSPAQGGPVAQFQDKPLAAAAGFHFAALVDAVMPWIEYGVALGPALEIQAFDDDFAPGGFDDDFAPGGFGGPDVMAYVRSGAEILKCFRGYSSVTYLEDGVQVTRGEWHFQDLD